MKSLTVNVALIAVSTFACFVSAVPSIPAAAKDIEVLDSHVVTDDLETSGLHRRNGELYCGNFASGDVTMSNQLVAEIYQENTRHAIQPNTCFRLKCRDTTGIWVCNDNSYRIVVTGKEIQKHADNVLKRCCIHGVHGERLADSMAGQQFTEGDWNVVVGYANCAISPFVKPSSEGGWGVNKSCKQVHMYIGA